jgi:ribose 5-phosphate isomerase A
MTRIDYPPLIIAKKAAAHAAANLVKDGMIIGLGTGSTASFFIDELGLRCQNGLKISAIATSQQSMRHAQKIGIPLINPDEVSFLDMTIDGADEIDRQKNMIKGGGGALLREKLIALASKEMVVVVDEKKLVEHLGVFAVPVEIASFAYLSTIKRLENNGYKGILRLNRDHSIYVTDNGNYLFDIQFDSPILNPKEEHDRLKNFCGVLETGLFCNIAGRIVVGYEDGLAKTLGMKYGI